MTQLTEQTPQPSSPIRWCGAYRKLGGWGGCTGDAGMPSGYKKEPVKVVDGVKYWECSRCKKPKPDTEFNSDKSKHNGLCTRCKSCISEVNKRNYAKRREALGHKVGEPRSSNKNWSAADHASAEWKKRNKDRVNKRIRDYRRKYPERARAREAVQNALNSGRLIKPKECEMCGRAVRLIGHHDSYQIERRLVVIWLCGKCHTFIHKQRDEQRDARAAREAAAARDALAEPKPTPATLPASKPVQTSLFDLAGEQPGDT